MKTPTKRAMPCLAVIAAALTLTGCLCGSAFDPDVNSAVSPDGKNEIRLYSDPLAYEVTRDGVVVVAKTEIGLKMNGKCVKDGVTKPCAVRRAKSSGFAPTPVYKKGKLDLSGNETLLDFGEWAVRLAARNDGVAYRFETKKPGIVDCEKADLTIPKGARCWFYRTERSTLGCEGKLPEFADASALRTDAGKAIYLPFVYSTGVNGKTVAVVDAGLHDYPVWNFGDVEQTEDGTKLKSLFAKYPKTTERVGGGGRKRETGLVKGGRWVKVKEREDFIAKADAPRAFPWRAFALADSPSKLCEADIFYALATPAAKDADFSWVKPGMVAWDWWNAFDNGKGCNTKTYVRFIDFAAKNGVEYVIFDEGWSANLDIWRYSPKVDVPYLIDYANKKGVGIILWIAWDQIYGEEEKVAEHFSKLGAKGFKVDFMDRGDAEIANFLEKFAAACAKHKMLIDYHGVYRPVGLQRTYPNILTIEGIHGLEQMKWAKKDKDMCCNDVACFFLRMTAGPMDYTPGAMDNYPVGDYRGNGKNPGSVGTRCHQMALMALYESPLQMLSDSPTKYEKNMECFKFMAKTPVVWDETVGLGGTPETFAAAARKAKDGSWYAAGITNKDARDFEFKTDFLGGGEWNVEMFEDAPDAGTNAEHYIRREFALKAGEPLKVRLAPGGGFAARFKKSEPQRGQTPSCKREGSFSMEDRSIGGCFRGLARSPCNSPVSPVLPAKIHSIIPQPLRPCRRRLGKECCGSRPICVVFRDEHTCVADRKDVDFAIMRTGRCISRTRPMYVERLLRPSENGTTSSEGRQRRTGISRTLGISLSPCFVEDAGAVQYFGVRCNGEARKNHKAREVA